MKKELTASGQLARLIHQMMRRRLEDAGLSDQFSPHSFRVTIVTDVLNQNVALEDVQYLAWHDSPTTRRIYDRGRRKFTRNIVERISIWAMSDLTALDKRRRSWPYRQTLSSASGERAIKAGQSLAGRS